VLIVVGGVHTAELEKPAVLTWIAKTAAHTQLTASVCTGVFLLAEAGVVTTQPVTTHWEDIADLKTRYPSLQVLEEQRWVEEGKLITSGGISSGIDMSLFLVSKLASAELAKRTARQMEYRWDSAYTTKNVIK
jgi:transcriptional regulator GlxA family with amidase domain